MPRSFTFHAKTVEDCWRIARQDAEMYQRRINRSNSYHTRALCLISRAAADRIALRIRYGKTKPWPKGRKG